MGYNLNRLMRQYGLATPTMAQYTGEMGPDVETIDEETGETITTPGTITFDPAKQAAFDDYQAQYQFRLGNRPMYESSQFRTTPTQQQPQTYEDMFSMYLGRQPRDGERNTFSSTGPVSNAQRNEFLRIYEPEFAALGINNTGNQLVSDQIGNYYGNILRNPDFNSNNNLPTPTNPVDPSAPFEERNPSAINPNPPYAGPVITTDEAYANAVNMTSDPYESEEVVNMYLDAYPDVKEHGERTALSMGLTPGTVEFTRIVENAAKTHWNEYGQEEGRTIPSLPDLGASIMTQASLNLAPAPTYETSDTFLNFIDQQNTTQANMANPVGISGYTDEEARNIDPYAPSSVANAESYRPYLSQNLDVYYDIMDQPGYKALNIPEGGFVPGSPEDLAVLDYMAQGALQHFIDHGRKEGRDWYKRGGEVKGYQLGGGYAPFGVSKEDAIGVTSDVGLSDGTETIVEEKIETVPNYQDTRQMVNLLLDAAPSLDKSLTDQRLAAQTAFTQEQSNFNDLIKNLVAKREKGPDKAELYFRLASAFAQPTKSKSFGFLENVPTVLADFAKDSRKAETKAQDLELSLAKTKMAQAQAKYNRIEDKQSSEAKSYREYMLKVFESLSKNNQKAMELFLKTGKEKFAQSQMPSWVGAQKIKDEESIVKLSDALVKMKMAEKLNLKTGSYTELDAALERVGLEGGSLTPKQKFTMEVRQLLMEVNIPQLKETFGAQLSDKETGLFMQIFGTGQNIADMEQRDRLIKRVIKTMDKYIKKKENRLAQINSGDYSTVKPKSKD